MSTGISYLDEVWNVTSGCTKLAEGCKNCYAHDLHNMRYRARMNGAKLPECYEHPFHHIKLHEDRLTKPLHWKKPRTIGVCFMSDLFHEDVPFEFIDRVMAVVALCPQHTFVVLTKRDGRMREYFDSIDSKDRYSEIDERFTISMPKESDFPSDCYAVGRLLRGSLANLWLGVSVSNQDDADRNIPLLLQTPAAHRFISYEPATGPVDFRGNLTDNCTGIYPYPLHPCGWKPKIDLIIMGGESGKSARPMHPDWARSVRDQCAAAGVAFYFKQDSDGERWRGRSSKDRDIDGVLHDNLPWRAK